MMHCQKNIKLDRQRGRERETDRQTDRETDRHDEANSRSSQFCERAWNEISN